MSRWEDSRDDFEASKENLESAKKAKMNKRTCPFCGDEWEQLPHHMRSCEEGP